MCYFFSFLIFPLHRKNTENTDFFRKVWDSKTFFFFVKKIFTRGLLGKKWK